MKIILASNSPRRKEILDGLKLAYTVMPSKIEEIVRIEEKPESVVMALAFEKAHDVSQMIEPDAQPIIIAADTIVVIDGKILGKPKTCNEAEMMLNSLSGRNHEVITGIALIQPNKCRVIDYVKTIVKFRSLTEHEISRYIETNEPMDKAGAYAIQGFGALLVEEIRGDYFNVVGLPINRLSQHLHHYFGIEIL